MPSVLSNGPGVTACVLALAAVDRQGAEIDPARVQARRRTEGAPTAATFRRMVTSCARAVPTLCTQQPANLRTQAGTRTRRVPPASRPCLVRFRQGGA